MLYLIYNPAGCMVTFLNPAMEKLITISSHAAPLLLILQPSCCFKHLKAIERRPSSPKY